MTNNYIFTGFGYSTGNYCIENNDLYRAIKNEQISGFNKDLILKSKNYQEYLKHYPNGTAFDYFVSFKMGFNRRYHVASWPPTHEHQRIAQTSLDLAIEAMEIALNDAELSPEQIDCWIVSTVSPHEVAPGIASTLKCYFVKPENISPATTLTSGCAGFNVGIRRAINYLEANKSAQHIVVIHTETMSHFLTEKTDFVSHATFGDAAAAIIVSRSEKNTLEGVICEANYHDSLMIDAVGVDIDRNLYMDGNWVKQRAVKNIAAVSREIAEKSGWTLDMIDMVVPHQTGNIILNAVMNELGIPLSKMFLEAQHEYGNVSGATIPIALSMLRYSGTLKPGMRILCPTAGVGGEYGAFSYIVPKIVAGKNNVSMTLENKTALVLYADCMLGVEVCNNLINDGCKVYAHCHSINDFTATLQSLQKEGKNIGVFVKKLLSFEDIENSVKQDFGITQWNYQLNLAGANELIYTTAADKIEMLKLTESFCHLTRKLLLQTKETVFVLGHAVELVNNPMAGSLKEFFSGLHGLAGSMSGEAFSKGIRTIWYIPGIFQDTAAYICNTLKTACKNTMRQENYGNIQKTARNIVKSLYLLKVADTKDKCVNRLIERTEQFAFRK